MEAISALAIGVQDLDGSGLLDAASEAERLDRMVQLRKLRIAYELVCAEAKRLGRLGDTDAYENRKAKALGLIASALIASMDPLDQRPTTTNPAGNPCAQGDLRTGSRVRDPPRQQPRSDRERLRTERGETDPRR